MKNNRGKKIARIVAMILAALMILTTLVSALSYAVWGATTTSFSPYVTICTNGTTTPITGVMRNSTRYTLMLQYQATTQLQPTESASSMYPLKVNTWAGSILRPVNTDLNKANAYVTGKAGGPQWITVYIDDLSYFVNNPDYLSINLVSTDNSPYDIDIDLDFTIPSNYISNNAGTGDSGSGTVEDNYTYTSNVVFESATVTDKSGKVLTSVDKDTEPFSISVTYTDTGLRGAELNNLRGTDIQAFFVPGGAFEITGTTRGGVSRVTTTGSNYPRFRVTFDNLKYTGAGNDLSFQVYYLFNYMDDPVKGEGAAVITEAKPDEEEDDEDEDKLAMAVPKIILDSYSYGEETIVAGEEFNLNFSIRNTSAELPLENITVTLTPASNAAATQGPGLLVASSSNTIYVPFLAAGDTMAYSVAFQARPDAEVTSHIIDVSFSYEYVDTVKKSRETAEMSESIAIPVFQIDRFTVDPLMEGAWAMPGEEAYLTVNFINRGKSTTYNISASIECESPTVTAAPQHYGNLDAGGSDYLDLYIVGTEPGEFEGDIIIQYEDENNNIKEVSTPFSLYVQEPWFPEDEGVDDFPGDMEMETARTGPSMLSIVLCTIGGLAIAAPIALYLMKRVRAKGGEDFDEDF